MFKSKNWRGISVAVLAAITTVAVPAAASAKGTTSTLGVSATVMACHSSAVSSLPASSKAGARSGSAAAVTQTCPVGLSWSASVDEAGTSLEDIQGRPVRSGMGSGSQQGFEAGFNPAEGSAPRVVTITY